MNKGWCEMSAAHFSNTRIAMGVVEVAPGCSGQNQNNLPFSYSTQAAYELVKCTFIIQSNFTLQLRRGSLPKV